MMQDGPKAMDTVEGRAQRSLYIQAAAVSAVNGNLNAVNDYIRTHPEEMDRAGRTFDNLVASGEYAIKKLPEDDMVLSTQSKYSKMCMQMGVCNDKQLAMNVCEIRMAMGCIPGFEKQPFGELIERQQEDISKTPIQVIDKSEELSNQNSLSARLMSRINSTASNVTDFEHNNLNINCNN